jgi:hypothetical protein
VVSLGKGSNAPRQHGFKGQLRRRRRKGIALAAEEPRKHPQDLARMLLRVEGDGLGQVEHHLLAARRRHRRVLPADGPPVGRHETAHDLEQRRLAGAVRADETQHLAAPDAEAHVLQRKHVAEAARNVADFQHGRTRGAYDFTAACTSRTRFSAWARPTALPLPQ